MAQVRQGANQRPVVCTTDPSLADQKGVLPQLLHFWTVDKDSVEGLLGRANKHIGIVCISTQGVCKLAILLLLFVLFLAILSHPLISIPCNMLKELLTRLWVTSASAKYINFGWDEFEEETTLSKHTNKLNKRCTTLVKIHCLVVHTEVVPLVCKIH